MRNIFFQPSPFLHASIFAGPVDLGVEESVSVENLDKSAIESELQKLINKGEALSKCVSSRNVHCSRIFAYMWFLS